MPHASKPACPCARSLGPCANPPQAAMNDSKPQCGLDTLPAQFAPLTTSTHAVARELPLLLPAGRPQHAAAPLCLASRRQLPSPQIPWVTISVLLTFFLAAIHSVSSSPAQHFLAAAA